MTTPSARIATANDQHLSEAAALLREGKLVAFPTETVYGLGADATNDHAVASIFAAKGRPTFNPLIIHVADVSALEQLVLWNDKAHLCARAFCPGPLTLVLPRVKECRVSLLASAGLETLAVRVPVHPIARDLLRQTGLPIAAPSANASGKLSPTTPAHVAESLGDKVDMILAGGKSSVGVESTVLDLSVPTPTILRPGAVTREMLEALIGPVAFGAPIADPQQGGLKSPGLLTSHYAPTLPLRLNASSANADEAFLNFGSALPDSGGFHINLSPSGDLAEAAAHLFAYLRNCDQPSLSGIAVAPIPMEGLGAAINDRLARAAAPRT